jgi:hypothetical protein
MHIHKPKAPHGPREFLSEISVIVVGILIALSLEAAIEWLHWRTEVRAGREHLREEVQFNERVYGHRVDVASCVEKNLATLSGVIEDLRSSRHVEPVARFISPENGPIRREIWNSLVAAQVLVHFPKDELEKYSEFYQLREDAEYFMDRESRAWRTLHLLEGDPTQLSRADLSLLHVAVGDAEEMGHGLDLTSRRQVELGRALGLDLRQSNPIAQKECVPIGRSLSSSVTRVGQAVPIQ